jgi:hypothetical protein
MSQASSKAAILSMPRSARDVVLRLAHAARNPAVGIVALTGCIDLAFNFRAGLGFTGFILPTTCIADLLAVALF